MTDRKIIITDCSQCPERGEQTGCFHVKYVPFCTAVSKALPYTPLGSQFSPGAFIAKLSPGIPDWCPLPPNNSGEQS